MIRTFRISYALKNAYRVNGIIYSIKQIPGLKKLLPENLYCVQGLKIFAGIISAFWEIISAFLGKLLYVLGMVYGLGLLYDKVPGNQVFLHIFFLLTIIGAYTNTYMFNPSNDKYYAISLMRMNARTYMLSNYGYKMIRVVIGFLPFTIIFGRLSQVPLWICILLPFYVAAAKLVAVSISLFRYERTGKNPDENSLARWDWIVIVLVLALAYALPAFGFTLPVWANVGIMTLTIVAGLPALKKIIGFSGYRQMCQHMLSDKRSGMDVKVTSQKIIEESNRNKISQDTSITSEKRGLEYFNDLFVKRHKKILWNSVKKISLVCVVIVAGLVIGCLWKQSFAQVVNEGLMKILPVLLFVMYLLNRGTTFTQALYMNCDHSMLTYSFYKKPGTILKLFWIRLRELVKINLLSAAVIGGGMAFLLWVSGGTSQPMNYLVIAVSILSMSVFFSVHYLTLYYLLQPYSMDAEIKSGMYNVLSWLTYMFCYCIMQMRMNSVVFGGVMIGFTVVYCIIAGILVYRMAAKTFRIRV